jgi:hypothetical protein
MQVVQSHRPYRHIAHRNSGETARRACSSFPERRSAARVRDLDDSVCYRRSLSPHRADRGTRGLDAISEDPEVPFFLAERMMV